MILTSPVWKTAIQKYELNDQDLEGLGHWVLRHYFSEKHNKKQWFLPNLTPEQALQHLCDSPHSPITPDQLSDIWRVMPVLRTKLTRKRADKNLKAVSSYLNQQHPKNVGELNLNELAGRFGNITKSMVNKIFINAAQKLRELTGGLTPEEMEERDLKSLMEQIDLSRKEAAAKFAATLKAADGNMFNFLESLKETKQIFKTELKHVSPNELEVLREMSLKFDIVEIEQILLTDIEEDENFFLLFQSAASKRLFANRVECFKEEEEDEPTDQLVVSPHTYNSSNGQESKIF